MTNGRRVLGLASAMAVLIAALASAPVGAAAPSVARVPRDPGSSPAYEATLAHYAALPVSWAPCFADEPDFECSSIAAPLDWAHPNQGDIQLSLTRILATGTRHGLLLTNPGGPGIGGSFMPLFVQSVEPAVAEHFDVVGMDPRGTDASTAITCHDTGALDSLYALDGLDRSLANTLNFLKFSKQEADACATDPLTPYINSDQTARDLDLVRAIFGDSKTSYLGFSAGTGLGAWYATLFPSRVDRFALDANTNFTTTAYDDFRDQPAGFQRRFDEDLLPWLAKYDSLWHLGRTTAAVRKTYEARRAALSKHPLTLADGSRLTGAGYDFTIAGYLYAADLFPDLADALSIIERYPSATAEEQETVTFAFAPYHHGGSDHTFWSTICNDTRTPPQPTVFADWLTIGTRYPLTGSTWLALPCSYWKFPAIGSPVTGKGIPPLLMLQNDGDPATPYIGGLRAHRNTPGSVLVTVRHEGDHAIYGAGIPCVEDTVNNWLLRGILPKKDLSCEGIPLPDPTARATSSVARTAGNTGSGMTALAWGSRFFRTHPKPWRQ